MNDRKSRVHPVVVVVGTCCFSGKWRLGDCWRGAGPGGQKTFLRPQIGSELLNLLWVFVAIIEKKRSDQQVETSGKEGLLA